MNAKYLIAILSLSTAAGAALADSTPVGFPYTDNTPSTTTRAQVEAGVRDAAQKGQLVSEGVGYPFVAQTTGSGLSRAEVKEQLKQAVAHGWHYPYQS